MTYCISCGKDEIQEYTLDEIFNCNSCMEKSATFDNDVTVIETINNSQTNSTETNFHSSQNSIYLNSLITQIDFLKEQIQEKDHFINQLLTILKNKTEHSGQISKVSTSSPILRNSIATPPLFSDIEEELNDNGSDTQLISQSSNEMNNTFIVKDEFRSSTANVEYINQQLKDVRLEQHKNYLNKKSIYSDLSLESFSDGETNKSNAFIKKATITQRNKVKKALEKLKSTNKEINARYRVKEEPFPWPKGTTLVMGDSILQGIHETRLRKYNIKIRCFPGSKIDDLYDYSKPLLKKKPTNVIIHCGTNDSPHKTPGMIINELKNLKNHIEETYPSTNVYFSTPTIREDDTILNKKLQEVTLYLQQNFELLVTSTNIDKTCLGKKGLHLNPKGSGRLAINLITLMKRL